MQLSTKLINLNTIRRGRLSLQNSIRFGIKYYHGMKKELSDFNLPIQLLKYIKRK